MKFDRATLEIGNEKDEDVAKKLSSAIEVYVRDQANLVLKSAEDIFTTFKRRCDENTSFYDKSLVEIPTHKILSNTEGFTAFQHLRDHIYNGPNAITDSIEWATLMNQGANVTALAELFKTQDGQAILLKRVFDSPEYTIAHIKRDLRMLQLHPPEIVSEAVTIISTLNSIADSAKAYAENAKDRTEATRKQVISYVQEKYDQFKSNLQSTLESLNHFLDENRSQILGELTYNASSRCVTVTENTVTSIGKPFQSLIDSNTVIYNLDLSKFTINSIPPTKLDIASPNDFDTAEEYSKLLNQENVFLPLAFKHERLTDSFTPLKFDLERFERDRAAVQSAYQFAHDNEKFDFSGNAGGAYRGTYSIPELRAKIAYAKARYDDAYSRLGPEGPLPQYVCAIEAFKGLPDAAEIAIKRKESELAAKFQIERRILIQVSARFGHQIIPPPSTTLERIE